MAHFCTFYFHLRSCIVHFTLTMVKNSKLSFITCVKIKLGAEKRSFFLGRHCSMELAETNLVGLNADVIEAIPANFAKSISKLAIRILAAIMAPARKKTDVINVPVEKGFSVGIVIEILRREIEIFTFYVKA